MSLSPTLFLLLTISVFAQPKDEQKKAAPTTELSPAQKPPTPAPSFWEANRTVVLGSGLTLFGVVIAQIFGFITMTRQQRHAEELRRWDTKRDMYIRILSALAEAAEGENNASLMDDNQSVLMPNTSVLNEIAALKEKINEARMQVTSAVAAASIAISVDAHNTVRSLFNDLARTPSSADSVRSLFRKRLALYEEAIEKLRLLARKDLNLDAGEQR